MPNDFKPPRMETIKKTAEIFGLPENMIRQKAKSGEIVAIKAGERYLVNMDKFAEYLNTNTEKQSTESTAGSRAINL
jgi:excisionase family DNA binding protein